jgi:Zn-finger domain-containing protein
MDERCPRSLKDMPGSFCPLAVLRLKAIRNAGRELSEEEEARLPGCSWALSHQLANYCFFQYIKEYGDGTASSDIEIASMLYLSTDTVKKVEKTSLIKMREDSKFKEIKEGLEGGESVVRERLTDDDLNIYI